MYCIFLGRAIQSTVPNTNSITPAMLGTTAVTTLTAGTGITTGTGTVYRSDVQKLGNIFHTRILIDLTGLASSGSGDIIGKAATANSHIGQITAAINGTPPHPPTVLEMGRVRHHCWACWGLTSVRSRHRRHCSMGR